MDSMGLDGWLEILDSFKVYGCRREEKVRLRKCSKEQVGG